MMLKHSWLSLATAAVVASASAGLAPELADSLQTIRAVGPEGRGHAAAAGAWQKVSAGDVATLLPILGAMDGANDYAMNWLRSAVEVIVSREQAAGRRLPVTELGQFVLETRHQPRARRLAFELLARVDPMTADKLLTGMLNDPSLEIRHDAVEKVIAQAGQTLSASNQAGASLLFQQALGFARDVKQIEAISKQLNALGQPVDLLKLFGFLTDWKIIGPFANLEEAGYDSVYPPEQKLDFAAECQGKTGPVAWRDFTTTHKYGMVDMNQPFGKLKGVLAYAATEFYSDRPQSVDLRLGGKNSWKVWLNGKLLFGFDEYHMNSVIDQYIMPAQLQPGRNTILVKACQNEMVEDWTKEWEFQLRVTDSLGTPIASARPAATAEAQPSNP